MFLQRDSVFDSGFEFFVKFRIFLFLRIINWIDGRRKNKRQLSKIHENSSKNTSKGARTSTDITVSWGNTFDPAARTSTPPRFSFLVLFIRSHRARPAGDAAETRQQQQHDGVLHVPLAQSGGSGGAKPPREVYIIRSVSPLPDEYRVVRW